MSQFSSQGQQGGHPTAVPSSNASFSAGADPFSGGNEGNIFDQAAMRQQQQANQPTGGNPSGLPNNPTPPQTTNGMETGPFSIGPQAGPSSLDKYMKKPDNSGKGEQQQPTPLDPFSFTNAEYSKLLQQQNFVPEISQDTLAAFAQGDFSGLTDIINQAVQAGASMSAPFATQISNKGVQHHLNQFRDTTLPGIFDEHSLNNEFNNIESDVLKHPTFQPLVKSKMQEFKAQYPDATNAQIVDATRRFFEDAMGQFNTPSPEQRPAKSSIGEFFKS